MTIFSKISFFDTLLFVLVVASFLLLTTAEAATTAVYEPLVGIPGVTDQGSMSLPSYLNVIYLTVIGLGALAGVIKIGMAGVKYSLSDVVTNKESARHDIMGVLLGLAILLIPFIVLNTIYPDLTSLNILNRASEMKVNLEQSRAKTNGGAGGTGGSAVSTQATGPIPIGTCTGAGGTRQINLFGSDSCALPAMSADKCRGLGGTPVGEICTGVLLEKTRVGSTGVISERIFPDQQVNPQTGNYNVTPAQIEQLRTTCASAGGSLTVAYGCIKQTNITCPTGQTWSDAFKKCQP